MRVTGVIGNSCLQTAKVVVRLMKGFLKVYACISIYYLLKGNEKYEAQLCC